MVGIIVLIAIAVVAYMALYGGGSSGGATTGGTGGGAGGGYFALALTAEQLRRVKQHIKRHR